MRFNLKNFFVLLWVFIVLFSMMNCQMAYAVTHEPNKVVRVAFAESKGLSETNEDGTKSGVFYDWFVEIAKYTGWEYEFIDGTAGELMEMMQNGQVDLMGGMYYMEQLEEVLSYPHYSIGYSNSLLIKRGDDNSIQSFDLSTLKGKKIGIYEKAKSKAKQLEYFLSFNSVSCELNYFKDPFEMEIALDSGKVDLLLGGDSYLTEDRSVVTQLGGEPYYIVTGKGQPGLYKQLDDAITEIYMTNPNFADEIYGLHFPEFYDNNIFLTDDDLKYIKNAPKIRVALMDDRYPLSYIRKDERKGICKDMFELIANQTGLNFEFVYAKDYQEMINLVSMGQADIVGSFMDEESIAQSKNLILTKSYVSLDEVILKNKKSSYPADDLIWALVEGRDIPDEATPKQVHYYPTSVECINAIERNKADVTCVPSAFVEDLFYRKYYTNVIIVASNMTKSNISIAIPKSADVKLFSILNKSINSLPAGEMDSIVSRNLMSLGELDITIKSLIYSNPFAFIAILGGFLFLVFLMVLFSGIYKMKNQLMRLKLQKAEESIQAKSEFLSQMSHEIRTPMNAIIGFTQLALRSDNIPPDLNIQLEKIDGSAQFLLSLVNDILDMSKIENSKMELKMDTFSPRTLMEQAESMLRVLAENKSIDVTFNCELQNEYFIGDEFRIKQVIINLLSNAIKFTEPFGDIILSVSEIEQSDLKAELKFSVKDTGVGIDKQDLERIFRSFEQAAEEKNVGQGTGLGLAISSNLVRLMGGELSVNSVLGQGAEFFFSICLPYGEIAEEYTNTKEKVNYKIDGMRILLAEDNDLNAQIVIFMLESEGITVERASDGQAAVDMFTSQQSGYYNLILMDIQMPVKSGLAATMEIREMDREDAKTIPIIAMTANTFKEDRDNAMEAGMDGFIPKPFEVEQLYKVIAELCDTLQ